MCDSSLPTKLEQDCSASLLPCFVQLVHADADLAACVCVKPLVHSMVQHLFLCCQAAYYRCSSMHLPLPVLVLLCIYTHVGSFCRCSVTLRYPCVVPTVFLRMLPPVECWMAVCAPGPCYYTCTTCCCFICIQHMAASSTALQLITASSCTPVGHWVQQQRHMRQHKPSAEQAHAHATSCEYVVGCMCALLMQLCLICFIAWHCVCLRAATDRSKQHTTLLTLPTGACSVGYVVGCPNDDVVYRCLWLYAGLSPLSVDV